MRRILIVMWLRNIVTACLGGGDKEIGEYLEIGMDHDCGESFNAEGDFFFLEREECNGTL
jgi:hypothetical protein